MEFYLERDVKSGQEKLAALTLKQKEACAAYLAYMVEKFEHVYLKQLKDSELYAEVESDYLRTIAVRDRFQALIK